MEKPIALNFSSSDMTVETIDQYYFTVDNERKFELLLRLLEREKPRQAIVFCRTKRGVDRLVTRLQNKVESVDSIHGDLAQSARDRVMKRFRDGELRYLVATDVVGRGIDVSGISHIVNYDTPAFCDDYVHRVGRTGRMGREGVAYTFVTPEEGSELTRIEQRINRLLMRSEMPGFELTAPARTPAPPPSESPPPPAAADDLKKRPARRYRRAL